MKDIIREKYQKLREDFAELNLLQRVVNDAFKREFEVLAEHEKSNDPSKIVSHEAFGFDNPFSGRLEKYAFRKTTIKTLKEITVSHKNTQYCWLIADAFEKFEKYLKFVYERLTTRKERDLKKILSYFSNNYDSLKKNEETNAFEVNLKIAVLLVEKLRHAIVHNQGKIEDLEIFTNKVINDSGINNNRDEHELFISQFFIENRVTLLESPIADGLLLQRYHNVYRHVASYLLSYAYLVNEVIVQPEESV
ncbi:MAG TPA: hypothetical protein DIW64_07395 [Cellvibrio sp.]|nr:hypothetical protein [Cellvibrio sp.]